MDNPTGTASSNPQPAAPTDPRRWVDADLLIRHIEQAREAQTSPNLGPAAPPPTRRPRTTGPRRAGGGRPPTQLPTGIRHGTPYAYIRLGCRCDPCTDAVRDAKRAWRRQRAQERQRQGSAA